MSGSTGSYSVQQSGMPTKALSVGVEGSTKLSNSKRKRALLNAMLAAAMQESSPVVPAGNGNIQANWADPLGKAFQMYMAQKGQEKLDEEDAATAQAIEAQNKAEIGKMFDPLKTDDMSAPQAGPEGPVPPNVALTPDLQSVQSAALAENPETRKQGLEMFRDYMKQMAEAKAAKLKPNFGQTNGIGYVQQLDEQGNLRQQTNPLTRLGPAQGATPTMPAHQVREGTGQVEPVGQGALGQDPDVVFSKENSAAKVNRLKEGVADAQLAVKTLNLVDGIKEKLAQIPPEQLGRGGPARMWLNQWAQSLGFKISPETARLEDVHSALGQLLLDNARAFAPVTKVDLDELKEILGSTKNSQQALNMIMDRLEKKADFSLSLHNNYVEKLQKKHGDLSEWLVDNPRKGKAMPGGEGSDISGLLDKYAPLK